MQISVIMAVYNRATLLSDLLEQWRIVDKATKYEYELIFSDDESSDESVAILDACRDLPLKVLRNSHGGAAKARNHAYQYAKGEIIIFTGDDIFPTPNFVNEHYETYLKNGKMFATLGRIDWRDGIQMNHLMKHITDIGCEQFGFIGMKPYDIIDFRHFYTSNISISREQLQDLDCLFDEGFKKYGFEDVELGYRLYKRGVEIFYNPNALAYHDHVYSSVEKFCNRQLSAGEEMNTFKRMHPELSSEEIKVDIDEFNEKYARYVSSKRKIDVVGDTGRLMIYLMLQTTKLLEKILLKKDLQAIRKICSRFYSIIFSYNMYLGLAIGYDKCRSAKIYQAKRYAFRYLFYGKSQLFFDKENEFTESNSKVFHTTGEKIITLQLDMSNKKIGRIRFDPLDQYCKIKLNYALVHLDGGLKKDIHFDYTNAKIKGNKYDFSTEVDSIFISDFLPSETKSVEIQYEINYLLKKRLWNGLKKSVKFAKKATKKILKYLVKPRNNQAIAKTLTIVEQETKRKVWVTINAPSNQDISSLIQEYQSICSFLPGVIIRSNGCSSIEYSEYVYEISDLSHRLENIQFLNAVLCLLQYDYDFVIISDNLEYFPSVYGDSVRDAIILAKWLTPFEEFKNSPTASTGKFIRIPGSRQIDYKIDSSIQLPHLKTLDGNLLFTQLPRDINWYNSVETKQREKSKPIVFVFPVFMAVGGVERNTIEVMNRLKNEYDFVVITYESHRPEQGSLFYQITDLCLAYFDLSEISSFDKYINLLEHLKPAYAPDLVWICNSSPWSMEKSGDLRRLFDNIPIVVQDVYDYKFGWIEYYDRPAIRSYDRFIAINKKIHNKFTTTYGINSEDIDLVYPAANTDKIRNTIDENYSKTDVLKQLNLNPDKMHFAFIGRLTEQKQPRKLFELAKYIVESDDNVDFVIVGDGELSADLEMLIEKNGLQNRIHRVKYMSNVFKFTKAMDGLVIASIYEGLPIVTIEAMCVGTPIFSTDVGDVALFVNENNIGVISENHEIETIKRSFDKFLINLDLHKQNAIQTVEKSLYFFSSERAASLMNDCFHKAVSKYQARAVAEKEVV